MGSPVPSRCSASYGMTYRRQVLVANASLNDQCRSRLVTVFCSWPCCQMMTARRCRRPRALSDTERARGLAQLSYLWPIRQRKSAKNGKLPQQLDNNLGVCVLFGSSDSGHRCVEGS